MQQAQDQLNFKIDTPSDEQLREMHKSKDDSFLSEFFDKPHSRPPIKFSSSGTKNQKKRARKAEKNRKETV